MECRAQIDCDNRVPTVDGERFDRCHVLNAGIVDQDINLSEGGFRRIDHRLYRRRLAHVRAVVQRSHFVTLKLTLDSRDRIRRAEAIDHDVGAFACECLRDA